ncbi:DUF2304 domain-containing protein [Sinomonas halotolerans]|uniref:DUF2304 domain-containing protein n=1 Tax=Sinomonas halotolerans TaxID=1644133 RepID=A0ABU9WWH0_9MICC
MIAIALVLSVAMLLVVLAMLRAGRLREKYAVLWLVIGSLTVVLGLFPNLLAWTARVIGVQVPSNLLFALSIVLLAGVSLHVSRELTVLEDETRILAEEVAILRASVERLEAAAAREPSVSAHLTKDDHDD